MYKYIIFNIFSKWIRNKKEQEYYKSNNSIKNITLNKFIIPDKQFFISDKKIFKKFIYFV